MTNVPEGNGFPLAFATGQQNAQKGRPSATPDAPMPKRFPPPTTDSIAGPVAKSAVVHASATQPVHASATQPVHASATQPV